MQTKIATPEYVELNITNKYGISAQKWRNENIDPMVSFWSYLASAIISILAISIVAANFYDVNNAALGLLVLLIIGFAVFIPVDKTIMHFANKHHLAMKSQEGSDMKVIAETLAGKGWTLEGGSYNVRGTLDYFITYRQARFVNPCGVKYNLSQVKFSKELMAFYFLLVDEKVIARNAQIQKSKLADHRLMQWEFDNGSFATEVEKEAFKQGVLAY